jgi:protein required for attachment to host cells
MADRTQHRKAAAWVVVADSGRARIFLAATPTAGLQELETLLNPEARLYEQDLVSDRHGRTFNRVGHQRSAVSREVDAKKHEMIAFAKQIAHKLADARTRDDFEKLVLVAAPAFLGLLRENLDKQTMERVAIALDKDFTQLRAEEVRERLPKRLR